MKDKLKAFITYVLDLYRTRTIIKLLGTILLLVLVFNAVRQISSLQVKQSSIPNTENKGLSPARGEIEKEAGETLVYDNGSKRMYVDPSTLNIRIEDVNTGLNWNALCSGGALSVDDKSLIKITFLGEDDATFTWDSYTYSVVGGTYGLELIDDGIRVSLDMKEMDSTRINEYMPQKIAAERYESVFIDGLNAKVDEGVLTEAELNKYITTLSLIYAKDDVNDYYYFKFSGSPPASAVKQLIEVTKILDYTATDMMNDNAEYGISVDIIEPANFIIPIEITLDGDDVVVKLSTYDVTTVNPYFMLTHIDVLPNFGSASTTEVPDGGYILVPDGSGALIEMNTFDANYGSYMRPVYNNTFYKDMFSLPSFPENLTMPIFGMTYGKNEDATHSYMAIIESGAEVAFVGTVLAAKVEGSGGAVFNKVYSGFDTAQYRLLAISGSSGGGFIAGTGVMDINYVVRYKLFTGPITYYDMAQIYRQYLIDEYKLTPEYANKPKMFLDVIGALTIQGRFLGLQYNKNESMTTYGELLDILTDLGDMQLVVNYTGFFNGGLNHKLMNRADMSGVNGSKKEYNELMDFAEQNGKEIFLQTNFSRVYNEVGNGFNPSAHAIYSYDSTVVSMMGYNYATSAFKPFSNWYYILNPIYLTSVVDDFLSKSSEYKNLYINDLAVDYYGNYRKNNILSPVSASVIVEENLQKLSGEKTLALNNPNIDKIQYGEYAANISRESSNYGMLYSSIPFRQLVMNGLIEYTTLTANMSGSSDDYYLLQALELGSIPKFEICARNVDFLKHTNYTDYVSVEYGTVGANIKSLYDKYEKAFSEIGSFEITNHRMLDINIFETTYANGVKVIVNYNKFAAETEADGDIVLLEPLGFVINNSKSSR